jgi:hypothetical protein
MKLTVNKAIGYRYRRYAIALLLVAAVWFPYAVSTFFIYPSWLAFAITLFLTIGGCVPLLLMSKHCFTVAESYFANERAEYARRQIYVVN